MKQSQAMSMVETFGGTALGFVTSLAIQHGIVWWYSLPLGTSQNMVIIGIFTLASLIRGYGWRRTCEAMHIRVPMSPFATAALRERLRQKTDEGWDDAHDDAHQAGELALAGACYAESAGMARDRAPIDWPWADEWWKPAGFRRDLVRAAALIIAEGEKFDRARRRK